MHLALTFERFKLLMLLVLDFPLFIVIIERLSV